MLEYELGSCLERYDARSDWRALLIPNYGLLKPCFSSPQFVLWRAPGPFIFPLLSSFALVGESMRWVRNTFRHAPRITTAGQGEKSYGYTLPLAAIFTLTYTACILGL